MDLLVMENLFYQRNVTKVSAILFIWGILMIRIKN